MERPTQECSICASLESEHSSQHDDDDDDDDGQPLNMLIQDLRSVNVDSSQDEPFVKTPIMFFRRIIII